MTHGSSLALSVPLGQPGFHAGLIAGLIASAACAGVGVLWRRRTGRLAPLAGLSLVEAALAGLAATVGVEAEVVLGVAVLATCGLVGDLLGRGWPACLVPALAGGWLIATSSQVSTTTWIQLLVVLATVGGAGLMVAFDRRWRSEGLAPPLLLVSALGVYATVPDTEQALVLVGAAVPAALLGWPGRIASLGLSGAMASAGLFAWTAAAGGLARPSAVVGGVASLGLLLAEPVARAICRGQPVLAGRPQAWWVPLAVVVQFALVAVTARVAGLQANATAAIVIAVVTLAGSVTLLVFASALSSRRAGRGAQRGGLTMAP